MPPSPEPLRHTWYWNPPMVTVATTLPAGRWFQLSVQIISSWENTFGSPAPPPRRPPMSKAML